MHPSKTFQLILYLLLWLPTTQGLLLVEIIAQGNHTVAQDKPASCHNQRGQCPAKETTCLKVDCQFPDTPTECYYVETSNDIAEQCVQGQGEKQNAGCGSGQQATNPVPGKEVAGKIPDKQKEGKGLDLNQAAALHLYLGKVTGLKIIHLVVLTTGPGAVWGFDYAINIQLITL